MGQATPVKRMLRTLWCGFISFWVAGTLYGLGDEIESQVFPIISNQSISNVEWIGDKFCWDWRFYKERNASVHSFTWQVSSIKNEEDMIFVSAETKSDSRPLRSSKTTPGETWRTLPLCVDVPERLRPPFPIKVQGQITYKTWTPWLVRQETQEVIWFPQL